MAYIYALSSKAIEYMIDPLISHNINTVLQNCFSIIFTLIRIVIFKYVSTHNIVVCIITFSDFTGKMFGVGVSVGLIY